MSAPVSELIIPSNPVDLKKIKDAMVEAEGCLLRIASEKDQVKAILDTLNENYPDIPKKASRKMINIHFKANLDQVVGEMDDVANLYESVSAAK